jgi:gas vesicle structural protein
MMGLRSQGPVNELTEFDSMTVVSQSRNRYLDRPSPSSLADVVDVILDKGLVIDIYVRVSLLGIELLTIDARIVIASVDTYLRFAEAVNRLDLTETGPKGLPEAIGGVTQAGSKGKTSGAVEAVRETVGDLFRRDEDEDEDVYEAEGRSSRSDRRQQGPARKRTSSSRESQPE